MPKANHIEPLLVNRVRVGRCHGEGYEYAGLRTVTTWRLYLPCHHMVYRVSRTQPKFVRKCEGCESGFLSDWNILPINF